jgi:signal transduction histidine kinase
MHPDSVGALGLGTAQLAELAHRVRTPLNQILGTLELLLAGELPDDARELAGVAHASALSLHRAFEEDLQTVHKSTTG